MQNFTLESQYQISGIGAASGIVRKDNSLFIISDSSSFLYEYHIHEKELSKIALFKNSQENISKKDKFDFESLILKGKKLYLFGSGSTSKRNKRISYNLENKEIKEKKLTDIYDKLKKTASISDDELNIEGALFYDEKWFFFQRGNGNESKNGVFIVSEEVIWIPIKLPKIQEIEATFTDAILVKDKIYFLAAAENSNSTYDDGEIAGSLIGSLSIETFAIEFTQIISEKHKFEGLTLNALTTESIDFLLCEDNDTEELETTIYKLTIKKLKLPAFKRLEALK